MPSYHSLRSTAVESTPCQGWHADRTQRRTRNAVLILLALLMPLTTLGCSRAWWRRKADEKTYGILVEKALDPRWQPNRIDTTAHPDSRFYDPYDVNCPPLPPDDPAAHVYMHRVYGKKGWKHWHKLGDTNTVENPYWLQPYGYDPSVVETNFGRVPLLPEFKSLTLEQAVALSYIHSRDYQTQIESLYLAALQLTFQRFLFDVQFLGLTNRRPSSDNIATDVPGVSDSIQSTNRIGATQLLPGGAQWAVELVNNTLWLFSGGGNSSSTTTILSYSLVQPLLANGGRRYVLESLTQSERDVLYALRNFARYRMGFFTTIVSGGTTAGISVGTPGVFTGVGPIPTPTSPGGYLGLLQQRQGILNQINNIRQIEERLRRLREQVSQRPVEVIEPLNLLPENLQFPADFAGVLRYDAERKLLFWRGKMTPEQRQQLLHLSPSPDYQAAINGLEQSANVETITQTVAQLETQLATAKIGLTNAQRQFQDTLDSYKQVIGLPTDTPVTIDESLLKPFELIDPRSFLIQDKLNEFVVRLGDVSDTDPTVESLRWAASELAALRDVIQTDGIDVLDEDLRRDEKIRAARADKQGPQVKAKLAADHERDLRLYSRIDEDFARNNRFLENLIVRLRDAELGPEQRLQARVDLADLREDYLKVAQGLQVVQANVRVAMISLNGFDQSLEECMAIGLENRQDLMNAKAQVMDARRKIEQAANQLKAVLNIVVAGDIRTQPLTANNHNPFDFRGDQSSIRAGVNFTAPVQLVQQRNAYRAAQIGYQQARRNYMRTEDQAKFEIRQAWRQITTQRENFETARDSLRYSTVQLDIAVEQQNSPVPQQTGGAQGVVLLQALSAVLNAQNQLIQIWVQYETNRLNIHNYMGILELDEQGFWTDAYYQERLRAAMEAGLIPACPPAHLPAIPSLNGPSSTQGPDNATPLLAPAEPNASPIDSQPATPADESVPLLPEPRSSDDKQSRSSLRSKLSPGTSNNGSAKSSSGELSTLRRLTPRLPDLSGHRRDSRRGTARLGDREVPVGPDNRRRDDYRAGQTGPA